MKHGHLVVFEGIDGCGKDTQMLRAAEWLIRQGFDVLPTREPTVSAEDAPQGDPVAQARWFIADRAQHVRKVIAPAIRAGKIVLCSRFDPSTMVYQCIDMNDAQFYPINRLNCEATAPVYQWYTILLDLPARVALARIQDKDAIEQRGEEYFEMARNMYLAVCQLGRNKARIVDATGTPDEVWARVQSKMKPFVAKWRV